MRASPWKLGLVAVVIFAGVIFTLPNFISRSTLATFPSWLPTRQITLGLDLQGGSHLLLEVDTAAVIHDRLQEILGDVRQALREARIGYRGIGVQGDNIVFSLTDKSQGDLANERLSALNPLLRTGSFGTGTNRELSIDYDDGRFRIQLTEPAINQRVDAAVTQSLEVVRRRIDELGTREASIQRQGSDRILVQVPGERDPGNIKRLLGQTARLTFHMVDLESSMAAGAPVPPGFERLPSSDLEGGTKSWVVDKRVELAGENLTDAQPTTGQNGEWVVSFKFDSVGARKFGQITQANVGKLFAIVLDDKVISAPRIREPILGGSGQISGHFTPQSATELAVLLRAGALPAPLNVVEERSVGPDLGADSIRAGVIATMVASVFVVGYMLLYYGIFGVFADIALILNIVLVLAVMSIMGATLTLPGIAGLILVIGQSVDSNVLIYERIREEAHGGRTPLSAIDAGFREALRTITDANVTSLIAALALFQFGTGPVKGFAVTHALGIVMNMFTAITFTRLLVDNWAYRTRPKAIPL